MVLLHIRFFLRILISLELVFLGLKLGFIGLQVRKLYI